MALITYFAWKVQLVTPSEEEDRRLLNGLNWVAQDVDTLREYLQSILDARQVLTPAQLQSIRFSLAPWAPHELTQHLMAGTVEREAERADRTSP